MQANFPITREVKLKFDDGMESNTEQTLYSQEQLGPSLLFILLTTQSAG